MRPIQRQIKHNNLSNIDNRFLIQKYQIGLHQGTMKQTFWSLLDIYIGECWWIRHPFHNGPWHVKTVIVGVNSTFVTSIDIDIVIQETSTVAWFLHAYSMVLHQTRHARVVKPIYTL